MGARLLKPGLFSCWEFQTASRVARNALLEEE
jgi:hypothetical protein